MKRQAMNIGATIVMCAMLAVPAFAQEPELESAQTLKNAALTRVVTVKPDFQVQRTELHRVVGDWVLVRVYPRDASNPPEDAIVTRMYGTWIGVGGPSTRFAPSERAGAPDQLFQSPGPYTGQDAENAAKQLNVGTKTYTGFGVQFDYPENATVGQQDNMLVIEGPESTAPVFQGASYEIRLSRAAESIDMPLDDWGFAQMQREIIQYNGQLTQTADYEGPFITPQSASYYRIGNKNVWQIDWSGGDNTRREFYLQAETGGPVAKVETNVYPVQNNPNAPQAEAALVVVLHSLAPAAGGQAGGPAETPMPGAAGTSPTPTATPGATMPITGANPPDATPTPQQPAPNLPFPLPSSVDIPDNARVFTDPTLPITATVGEIFLVALESNPSTGYSWQLTGGTSAPVVQFIRNLYVPDASGRIGAAGTDRFAFRAMAAGRTILSLEYSRPWETGVPPVHVANFTVIITAG